MSKTVYASSGAVSADAGSNMTRRDPHEGQRLYLAPPLWTDAVASGLSHQIAFWSGEEPATLGALNANVVRCWSAELLSRNARSIAHSVVKNEANLDRHIIFLFKRGCHASGEQHGKRTSIYRISAHKYSWSQLAVLRPFSILCACKTEVPMPHRRPSTKFPCDPASHME